MTAAEKIRELGLKVGDECEVLYCTNWCTVVITAIGRQRALAYYPFRDEEIFLSGDSIRRIEKPVTLEEAMRLIDTIPVWFADRLHTTSLFGITRERVEDICRRYHEINLRGE